MIQQILQALDAAAAQHLPVAVRHLLTEQQPTGSGIAPHVYVGNGNWNPIANDNAGTFSYWRLMSPIREQEVDAPGCFDAFQATYNLRLVSMIDRDICGDVFDATRAAATAIRNTDDDLRAALKLMLVDFSSGSVEVQSSRVYNQEFGGGLDVNPNKTLVAIDVTISVTGRSSCFEPCIPTPDFFCALIEAKTWSKIKGCMTAGQIADAIEDLCDDAPCHPLSVRVNGEPYATIEDPCGGIASIEVVQGDVPVGELIGGQWVVPECPPCDDLTISINAEDGVIIVPNPCGESVAIAVTQGGVEVGTWNGTAWIVPECEDAEVTFDGLPVLTIPCGDTGNLDCGTLLDAAYVQDGGSVTGTYLVTGTLNGREIYTLDVDHNLEYTGTRWRLVKPGSDVDAALGSETFPWDADWSATSVTVQQATIGAYCGGNEVPCADLTVTINDEAFTTVADPCGASLNVQVVNEDAAAVGSLVGGQWVVPTAETLCALIGAATAEEISDCIIADGARADVLAELIPTVDDADVITQIWDVMTPTQQDEILDNECPVAPANVLREYTTGGSWSKPTDASFQGVWVFAAGAGGSGGAGNLVSSNTAIAGGAGGGGGSIVRRWIPAASLLTTETYAIGAGAAGVATGNGGTGGATLFGLHAEAKGGSGGADGTTATSTAGGAGGNALLNVPIASGTSISGGVGGIGRQTGATTGTAGMTTTAGAGGGGGGGRTTTVVGNGNQGGGCYNNGSLTAGGAGGIANGGNGTAGANDIYLDPFLGLVTSTIGIGTSGGGGAGNTGASAVAGSGAAGGRAAGGGGGGSQSNGAGGTRGASGAGGDGFLLVYEVFAI
jgi:hypothetical protein